MPSMLLLIRFWIIFAIKARLNYLISLSDGSDNAVKPMVIAIGKIFIDNDDSNMHCNEID